MKDWIWWVGGGILLYYLYEQSLAGASNLVSSVVGTAYAPVALDTAGDQWQCPSVAKFFSSETSQSGGGYCQ